MVTEAIKQLLQPEKFYQIFFCDNIRLITFRTAFLWASNHHYI